mmetsp:Transcript_21909/g.46253  ORF Transcript_21909/g.46253 Transcript_21909/m.46253 type:complete len:84 (+) Transcript_21909:80-331(+)
MLFVLIAANDFKEGRKEGTVYDWAQQKPQDRALMERISLLYHIHTHTTCSYSIPQTIYGHGESKAEKNRLDFAFGNIMGGIIR